VQTNHYYTKENRNLQAIDYILFEMKLFCMPEHVFFTKTDLFGLSITTNFHAIARKKRK